MKKRKFVKLNRYEKCIIHLAEEIQRNPYTEYDIEKEVLDILGLEFLPKKLTKNK